MSARWMLTFALAAALHAAASFAPERVEARFRGLSHLLLIQEGGRIQRFGALDPGEALAPCSTFKLPHAVLALEEGALAPGRMERSCDPKECHRGHRTLGLEAALRHSCVSYFRQVARELGAERERAALARMGYPATGSFRPADGFWLSAEGMGITAHQQLAWIRRFYTEDLGVKPQHLEAVRRASLRADTPAWTLWGKTGSSHPRGALPHGWFVGRIRWKDGREAFVAVLVKGRGFSFLGLEAETRLKALLSGG